MVKILICGDVDGNWDAVFSRVAALQKSAHGPFSCLFCTGKVFSTEEDFKDVISKNEFIIPTYVSNTTSVLSSSCSLPNNLEILEPNKLLTIQSLTVAMFSKDKMTQSAMIAVKAISSSGAYRGCDLLLSDTWPYDSHQFLNEADIKLREDTSIPLGVGSSDVSNFAMLTRPRYHFSTGHSNFYQRPPFAFPSSTGAAATSSRFISLAGVSKSKDKNHKWLHALSLVPITHMSATELQQDASGCGDCPFVKVGIVGKRTAGEVGDGVAKKSRLNPPPPPGQPPSVSAGNSSSTTANASFFFNDASSGRSSMNANRKGPPAHLKTSSAAPELETPSTTIRSLFVGNLQNGSSQEDIVQALLPRLEIKGSAANYSKAISRVNEGVSGDSGIDLLKAVGRFHRPEGKSFAFVDCLTHADALGVMELAKSKCINVDGRTLSVGWGKESDSTGGGGPARKHRSRSSSKHTNFVLNLNAPSRQSTTLFAGNLPQDTAASELVGLFGSVLPSSSAGLTLADVMVPAGRGYAFIEFRSAADAEHVMDIVVAQQTLVENAEAEHKATLDEGAPGDGNDATLMGKMTEVMSQYEFLLHNQVLSVGWAKGKSADRVNPHSTHSQDCWFCLASPQVKAHMIISISEHCYVALARGGIVDFHVMIVPIDCVPNRLHLSTDSKKDLLAYEVALSTMFERMPQQGQPGRPPPPALPPPGAQNALATAPTYLCIRFERAIRTKGKDHMQYQLVPVHSKFLALSGNAPPATGDGAATKLEDTAAVATFFKCIANYGLDFFELQNTLDAGSAQPVAVDEVVLHMEGGPYQEYFYVELPCLLRDNTVYFRRFVYVDNGTAADGDSGKGSKPAQFPMHLGNEIVAQIIQQPHRSNWKNCLLSEASEVDLVDRLKSSFASFDFTN